MLPTYYELLVKAFTVELYRLLGPCGVIKAVKSKIQILERLLEILKLTEF